jgi:predicted O-linked N-acetylglucosamine transferase (SPINDLY family)
LRIGYVSPDLRNHSVAYFFEPVLDRHDREGFEIFCYHLAAGEDGVTQRLKASGAQWRNCFGEADEAIARRIRDDGIDILVDLAGHTANQRLGVFARKPAAVQMSWLGFPSTIGLPAIDYRITDMQVDLPGYEAFNVETPLRLPFSYFCYRPGPAPQVAPPPCLSRGSVTFGSFNNLSKLSLAAIGLWSRVLLAVPGSTLLLKGKGLGEAGARGRVEQAFAQCGVPAERLDLNGWENSAESHLARYHDVDIALDSYPYNGATTTCEALWMGVPVVSLAGRSHASRMGLSLLTAAGLAELACADEAGFVVAAAALAVDHDRLAAWRQSMRERLQASPLMDERGFTRALEDLYRQALTAAARSPNRPATEPETA